MKILDRLSFLPRKQSQSTLSGRLAVVHWDRDNLFYLISSGAGQTLKEGEYGVVSLIAESGVGQAGSTGSEEPKRVGPLVAFANHLQEHRIHASRVVVLLSRPELDLLTLSLPPAAEDEMPTLVASEVEQQQGESPEPALVDFYQIMDVAAQSQRDDDSTPAGGKQVFAFALSQRYLDQLQQQCSESGFKLAAIGSRHLAPLSLLRRSDLSSDSVTISIHLLTGEAEVAICRGSKPLLLRSIRYAAEDPERVAEQIDTEANRCLTLLPEALADLPVTWIVYQTGEFAEEVAKAVEAQEPGKVRLIDPLAGWSGAEEPCLSPDLRSSLGSVPTMSAASIGTAMDLQQQIRLPVNLLDPKRAPAPPNPWVRWGALGGLGAAAILAGGYFLLSDIWALQDEVTALQNTLKDTAKVTAKYQEKSDQVTLVEGWLGDQVDWVAELSDLAARLPDGQDATVRRLTATINAKGNGALDLSMQVKSQEIISELENRIRGAKYTIVSKQITENAESQEYPWQFESHIEFPIESPGLRRFVAGKGAAVEKAKAGRVDPKSEPQDSQASESELQTQAQNEQPKSGSETKSSLGNQTGTENRGGVDPNAGPAAAGKGDNQQGVAGELVPSTEVPR